MPGHEVHDMSYYSKCMVGGILSCGLTHTIMCPLDIVKCRKQVSPSLSDLINCTLLFLILIIMIYRLTPPSIRAFLTASRPSTELKVSEVSLS